MNFSTARIFIFSFIIMYGRTIVFFTVLHVLALCNLILAFATLKNKAYKNVFTAFGSKGDHYTPCVNLTKIFSAIVLPGAIFFSKVKYRNISVLYLNVFQRTNSSQGRRLRKGSDCSVSGIQSSSGWSVSAVYSVNKHIIRKYF